MKNPTKDKPIADFAQKLSEALGQIVYEGAVRRLDRQGVVQPARDPWGRRLFGDDDFASASKYLARRRRLTPAA